MTAGGLFKALAGLGRGELRQLKARVDFLLAAGDGEPADTEEELFYDSAVFVLKARGFTGMRPYAAARHARWFKQWEAGVTEAVRFAALVAPGLERTRRARFYRLLITICLEEQAARGRGADPAGLAYILGEAPALFEREFPGYAAAGLAATVVGVWPEG